jgi:hypothetical protein
LQVGTTGSAIAIAAQKAGLAESVAVDSPMPPRLLAKAVPGDLI